MTPVLDAAASLTLDLDGVSLIEASAGTGKTHAIANLYLRQILQGHSPAEILVVSFTNAATEELLQRIQRRLSLAANALQGALPEDEFLSLLVAQQQSLDAEQQALCLRRLQQALHSMDEAMISTIHGFCFSALQDHALLSQQAFDSEILSDDTDLWEAALKDWWRQNAYPLSAAAWSVFARAVPNLNRLLNWHNRLRKHPGDRILPQPRASLAEMLQAYADNDDEASQADLAQITAAVLCESRQISTQAVARQKQERGCLAYQDLLDRLLAALQGPAGEQLAAALRAAYPVAMIDEFQDTDPVQFEIFRRLYFTRQDTSLTLIGDPKQAIYGFRGGDIFTYIRARSEPGLKIYALQTNWRSEPALIDAVNAVFDKRAEPFIYDRAIGFHPALPAPREHNESLSCGQRDMVPMTIWKLPLRDNGKTFGMAEMQDKLVDAVVSEIAKLLDPNSDSRIGERALQSGDIAVLVRERNEGNALRNALAAVGIRAVTIGREQVFHSDEAQGLYDLLTGIAHPRDGQSLRRARASNLFALDYSALAKDLDDDSLWQTWVDHMQSLHETWLATGFIAMYQQMLQQLGLGLSLAEQAFAERRLTNLSHLAELLQRQSRIHVGIDALLGWYRQQLDHDGDDATELRLESDAELVKIVTVHKSKGLEYPVVFLPFLWRCKRATWRSNLLRFHSQDYQASVDIGSNDIVAHGFLAEKERLAEDLRLLYVALTRARSKLYLAWGDAGDGRAAGQPKHTALAWLLHSQQSAQELEQIEPCGFDDAASLYRELATFASNNQHIESTDLPTSTEIPSPTLAAETVVIEAREFSRSFARGWRIGSFSNLTRDVHQVAHAGERDRQGDPILDFPAGSHIGLLLHELLEKIDFQQDIKSQGQARIAELAPGYGIQQNEQQQVLSTWLQNIVDTEIGDDGLRLSVLPNSRRLNELKFDFAVDHFDVDAINRLLQNGITTPLQPITAAEFRGLITGIIDLVFEFNGRYYLADYKSNFLGARLDDYGAERLQQAMYDRRYDLQSLLYAIALHRYLGQRVPGYAYERHFGGSYYLFVRAMRPQSGTRFGVHFERPEFGFIEALERELKFSPPTGA